MYSAAVFIYMLLCLVAKQPYRLALMWAHNEALHTTYLGKLDSTSSSCLNIPVALGSFSAVLV